MTLITPPAGSPQGVPELFLLDADPSINLHVPRLRESFRVTTAASVGLATEYLARAPLNCQFLVSDVSVDGQETFDIFRRVKAWKTAPTILVTTADVERVPDALIAGADTVLLKPFAPNLLFSRLGRLRRERARNRAVECPLDHCPHCNASPVRKFDFVSHRRAWFGCLACKKVWIAKELDQ